MASLFKYRKCNNYTLDIFRTGKLHFSRPIDLNDPFDCKPFVDSNLVIGWDAIGLFATDDGSTEIRPMELQGTNNFLKEVYVNSFYQVGIFCVSARGNCLQMWAHYADDHQGLCLEFDAHLLTESLGLRLKVHYNAIPYVVHSGIDDMTDKEILKILCSKQKEWEYEKEYRFIKRGSDMATQTEYPFLKEALTAIYFGLKCSEENMKLYMRTCKENGFAHVKFYKMALAEDMTYDMGFCEINIL